MREKCNISACQIFIADISPHRFKCAIFQNVSFNNTIETDPISKCYNRMHSCIFEELLLHTHNNKDILTRKIKMNDIWSGHSLTIKYEYELSLTGSR